MFDDVPPGPDGYASSTFSKRYSTFWKSLDVAEPGRRVSFHSFRHNFRDNGSGVLAVDMTIRNPSGTQIFSVTRSDASDILGVTVAGNVAR